MRRVTAVERMRQILKPGHVYRREDFLPLSNSVDRHLRALVRQQALKKLRKGMYYCPRKFEFGEAPAEEQEVVRAFLRSDRFVVTSPSVYNQLNLGTTQLYNRRVVYNQKRHGTFELAGRTYEFQRRPNVPKTLTQEFLVVDLVNELDRLAEDPVLILARVRERSSQMDHRRLSRAVSLYGNCATQKRFKEFLNHA